MIAWLKHNILGVTILSIALLFGLANYADYGLSSDEHLQRDLGKYSYNFVANDDPTYTWYGDNDYGVATEMPLYFIVDVLLNKTDSKSIYQTRHLVLHLLFLVAVFMFFLLGNKLFKNQLIAALGSLILLLHPRIYAHSFFNSKDLPLLSFIIIGLYVLFRFIEHRKLIWLLLLAIISALIINNRIIGLMFYCLVFGVFGLTFLYEKNDRRQIIIQGLIFAICSLLTLYITWPILWESPVYRLGVVFKNMAYFRWEDFVLFNGEIINATELPWNYIPFWLGVTTPIIILILGCLGVVFLGLKIFKALSSSEIGKPIIFMGFNLGLFVLPILTVILLNSVVYDGWRHLYFIYPSFVLSALYFLKEVKLPSPFKQNRVILIGVVVLILAIESGIFMLKNHPNEQVYFNAFIEKNEELKNRMELDYWGLSYRGALEYILENDSRENITIAYETGVCEKNALMLNDNQKKRLSFTSETDSADYFVTNYRWHMIKGNSFSETLNYDPIYDLKYGKTSIMSVWKLNE